MKPRAYRPDLPRFRRKSGHHTRYSLPTTPTTQQKPGASCDARLAYIHLSFVSSLVVGLVMEHNKS
jgi:hypothetical protein